MKQISLPLKTTMILQDLSFANIMVIDQKFVYHPKLFIKIASTMRKENHK